MVKFHSVVKFQFIQGCTLAQANVWLLQHQAKTTKGILKRIIYVCIHDQAKTTGIYVSLHDHKRNSKNN
jgi:hypothetical protein